MAIDINLLKLDIDFTVKVEGSGLNLKYNLIRFGIAKKQLLKDSAYNQPLKALPGGLMGNVKLSDDYTDDGATVSTADSFLSVWNNTPLPKYFAAILNKKADLLINVWYGSHEVADRKKGSNSIRALLRQAYNKMANEMMSKPDRAAQKGHDFFAIGTGQTYLAMTVEVLEKAEK